jgi:prephenate dehydrogenase
MQTVVIVGVGLIGASFGLALKEAGFNGEIVGVSSSRAIDEALAVGAITRSASFEDACHSADLIYLSQTVDRILETLTRLPGHLKPDVLITDAGSTKGTIVGQAALSLPNHCFVGGHPLAGKESRGAAAADANLFRKRPYVLTPAAGPDSPHIPWFRNALLQMGAVPIEVSPESHDSALAFTSHLPQLISTALAGTLDRADSAYLSQLFGPGLIDMTRLALSSPDLWSAILTQNRDFVLHALDSFVSHLENIRAAVAKGDIQDPFEAGRHFAASIRRIKL